MKSTLLACAAALVLTAVAACGGGDQSPSTSTRTWRMGFSANPPRLTTAAVIEGIDRWSLRAEYAAIHEELPWTDLLGGMSPDDILDRDKVQLIEYMRGKGLQLYFMADLTDGRPHCRPATSHAAQLLDAVNARGFIQLLFADIDLASLPPPIPANLPLFVNIELPTATLTPSRPLQPGMRCMRGNSCAKKSFSGRRAGLVCCVSERITASTAQMEC